MATSPHRLFYVSMIEKPRFWRIAGPYETHEAALAAVDTARRLAIDKDPYKHFALFGTCSDEAPARKTVFGVVQPETWVERITSSGQGELAL